MPSFSVKPELSDHYADYYVAGKSEWRALGAVDKVKNIQALCAGLPHQTILDVGAGEGSVIQRLSDVGFGAQLHALEISASGVATIEARKIARLRECKLYDGYHIPYSDSSFDLAILSHVVEHVEYPRQVIAEAARVAKHLFIEVPLEDTLSLKKDFVLDAVGHINVYSPKTIRHLTQSCGLEVVDQIITNTSREGYVYQGGYRGLLKFFVKEGLLKLAPALAPVMVTYNSSLVCRKSGPTA
jgi:SAM-dependent methyltransferase